MDNKAEISFVIIMGDSLSDRGTMYNRQLFHFIHMSVQSGLKGKAAVDSFTNGLPWSDHFIASLANHFIIQELKKDSNFDSTDISDAVIHHENKIYRNIHRSFNLKNDLTVKYGQNVFARTYIEGGLTADDFSHKSNKKFCFSPTRLIVREILSNLEKKRQMLLADDIKNKIISEDKNKTLVIEWSGANDLITVNKKPTEENADFAIRARMQNVTELMKNGYHHFVLFNLPDISLTLRYRNKSEEERVNAKKVSYYFNQTLKLACEKIKKQNPNCTIDLFDVNEIFLNIYKNPEKYNIDKNKLNQAYLKTNDFKIHSNHTSPAVGYMFWDDVHPTADVHAIIAYLFYEYCKQQFTFSSPRNEIQIRKRYNSI